MNPIHRIEAKLARIQSTDGAIGAFTALHADEARAAAAALGEEGGPLHGLTFAVKDNIAVAGHPWTGGLAGRRDVVAEHDAPVVARLRAAGAVLLGQLNQHEGALGGTTDNPTFGRTLNPLGAGLTPGGSSGGSGAAVAADFVDFALGSDTMGSVRLPAAYCGVRGLKPTTGAVPRTGFVYLSPSLDTIGPLARSEETLIAVLEAMAGADPGNVAAVAPAFDPAIPSLAGLRIGVPGQLEAVALEPEVAAAFTRLRAELAVMGAEVIDIDVPDWDPTRARRAGLLVCEVEGAAEMAALLEVPGALSDDLSAMLRYGRDAEPARIADARATVAAAGEGCRTALGEVDALLMPTAPQRAFAFDGPHPANQADLTALANFAGCPSIAFPIDAPGLPASAQLIGPPWSERRLCAWAEAIGKGGQVAHPAR